MNKKILISTILVIIIILIIVVVAIMIPRDANNEEAKNKEIIQENQVPENIVPDEETIQKVENIKDQIGATADSEIYNIEKEYDGREILVIKPDVQFKTVLAGILKHGKPSKQDIEELELSKFKKGVWISEISRDRFLQILKKCGLNNFSIDEKGYLYKNSESQNEYSSKLENLINSNKLTIVDITGKCYTRDEMTGEILEYPFKDMDLYQICEKYETQGSRIIVITTNEVEEADILQEVCN